MSRNGMGALLRQSFYAAAAAIFVTGAAWLALHYLGGAGEELDSPLRAGELWALRLHGAAADGVLLLLGSIAATHVPAGWAKRGNRATGVALLAGALVLAASGWALYYAGSETLRAWASALHWALGLAAGPLLAWHVSSRCIPSSRCW